VDVNAFKVTLIRWIIVAYMVLSCIEVDAFRDLIKLLNPVIYAFFFKAGDSIRRLILSNYEEKKERVRKDLYYALSKIYISFNLWTSPNGTLVFCAVIIYYLN
jgi:hypothetical protein